MNYFVSFLLLTTIWKADAKTGCATIPDVLRDTSTQWWSHAEAALNFTQYNTQEMKFYVMTPKSYPNLENPGGEEVDWSTLECKDKQILFNCHGFREEGLQVWAVDLARTFVQQYGACAVMNDYKGASESINYLAVVLGNTDIISNKIADYIGDNICANANCSEQLQMHGHSWGAHTCGLAGYKLGQLNPMYKPARMIASDAAGPFFNVMNASDPRLHLSTESANVVINIKTSMFDGSSSLEWAHQTQYIGNCGSNQDQCEARSGFMDGELCDHQTSVFITKSTMIKSFPKANMTKCVSCKYLDVEDCTEEQDYLGWQSQGIPGLFIIKDIPFCLNVTIDGIL